jgi:hypothetical protein
MGLSLLSYNFIAWLLKRMHGAAEILLTDKLRAGHAFDKITPAAPARCIPITAEF